MDSFGHLREQSARGSRESYNIHDVHIRGYMNEIKHCMDAFANTAAKDIPMHARVLRVFCPRHAQCAGVGQPLLNRIL